MITCPECGGSGKKIHRCDCDLCVYRYGCGRGGAATPCHVCDGTGRVSRLKNTVEIARRK